MGRHDVSGIWAVCFMIRVLRTLCKGCYELQPLVVIDIRGGFVKTVHRSQFDNLGLRWDFVEQYYSSSHKRVLRGMHYQASPMQHAKLIYCVQGRVLDVALDLRFASATFRQYFTIELSADLGNMVYLAPGFAHGFYVFSESATLVYNVTSEFSAEHDLGLRWNSFGFCWPDSNPIVSVRDANLPELSEASYFL